MTVLIAGGGTGGHVFPMLAVGEALEQLAGANVVYVGTERGIEKRAVPHAGGRLELLDVRPLRGGGVSGFVRGAIQAVRVLPEARALVKRIKPDVVLSVGGYAAGPVSLAARMLGIPVTLLEPNSYLGLANRLLAPVVARAYTAYPEVSERFPSARVQPAGVPLRQAFAPQALKNEGSRMNVLVLGGSQGARSLNRNMPAAVRQARDAGVSLSVRHQAGRGRGPETEAAYLKEGLSDSVVVTEFIDDVAHELEQADLVVQRAGASSIAELCAVGRPSILVPFPFAADQHQLKNAQSLERAGAAIAVEDKEGAERIGAELIALGRDRARRRRMADAARELGRPDAAKNIAEDLLALARRARMENN